jgi:hypothetical protein
MPKLHHEAVVEILQNEPELVLQLLACAGVHLQFGTHVAATLANSDLSDREPEDGKKWFRNLFSDNVFVFEGDGRQVAVIAEVQTDPPDRDRSLSWPAYVANARRRHRCDTLLMVFATDEDAARGSAKPIRTGHPGWDLTPLISGIGRTPAIPAKGARCCAELVLLRIITCELELNTHDARMFALAAIQSAPPERLARYTGYLKALVPPSIRRILETMMKTVFKDPWVDGLVNQGLSQGRNEGRHQGRAEMLLELLDMRFSVSSDMRSRVEECADAQQIKTWFRRALSAASIDEVFAELQALAAKKLMNRLCGGTFGMARSSAASAAAISRDACGVTGTGYCSPTTPLTARKMKSAEWRT